MSIEYILIRNLNITLFVISIPLLIMYFSKKTGKNRAIDNADKIIKESGEILQLFSTQYTRATGDDIMQFLKKNIIKGLCVIIVICLFSLLNGMSAINYWFIYAILIVYVSIFMLKDVIRILPFKNCYNVIGIRCGEFMGVENVVYVCFYDFINEKYVITDVINDENIQDKKFVRLLVVVKHNNLQAVRLLRKNT